MKTHETEKQRLIARARELRKTSTDAEQLLWSLLRARGFFGIKFRRQHPIGRYVADFACTEHHLIVELDGGQHNDEKEKARDAARTQFLESQGWKILRFWNHEVFSTIEGVLTILMVTLTPALSLSEGEGEDAISPLPHRGRGLG